MISLLSESAYVMRINCGRLDVGQGLFSSLEASLDNNYFGGSTDLMAIGTSMSDSEVDILVDYISSKVSSAPQYFDLGERKWCFATVANDGNYTYLDELLYKSPLTITCQKYTAFKLFDYKAVLNDNNLGVIIAYAFDGDHKYSDYSKEVRRRSKILRTVTIIIGVQIPLHLILLVSGLLAYSGRGSARNLHMVPKRTLNAIAAISLVAGLTVTIATVVMVQTMVVMKAEVHSHLKSYGISLNLGVLYFTLHWFVVGCSAFCMIVWAFPLWCGNPAEPVQYEQYDDDFAFANTTGGPSKDTYFIKPYNTDRTTQAKKKIKHSASRLFDESFVIPENEEMVHMSDLQNPFEDRDPADLTESTPPHLSGHTHSEWELRALGEKMSRKLSVRRTSRSMPTVPVVLPLAEDTRNLLYGDNFSNHQYPQALPRSESSDLTRSSTMRLVSVPETETVSSARTRVLLDNTLHPDSATKAKNESSTSNRPESISNSSILNDQEMVILDQTNFFNRL